MAKLVVFTVALTRGTLTVAESYQRIDGQDVLTDPKTPKSKRVIAMPRFFAEEMKAFLSALDLDPGERIFPVTKYFLSHEMARGSKAAGLEPIRIHDLRHSHVSLLIDMGAVTAMSGVTRPCEAVQTNARSRASASATGRMACPVADHATVSPQKAEAIGVTRFAKSTLWDDGSRS